MILTVLLIGYGVVAVLVIRPIAGHFAWAFLANDEMRYPNIHGKDRWPDGDKWFGATALATVIAAIWPVACAWVLLSRHGVVLGAERQARVKAQQDRIRQLEHELEVAKR